MQFDNEIDQMRYELGVLSSGLSNGGFFEQVATKLSDLEHENARLREALQHADAALDSLMSDEMPYTESCRIWRTAVESIRAALDPSGQKERRAKALSDLAEMDADLLDIDPEMKP